MCEIEAKHYMNVEVVNFEKSSTCGWFYGSCEIHEHLHGRVGGRACIIYLFHRMVEGVM